MTVNLDTSAVHFIICHPGKRPYVIWSSRAYGFCSTFLTGGPSTAAIVAVAATGGSNSLGPSLSVYHKSVGSQLTSAMVLNVPSNWCYCLKWKQLPRIHKASTVIRLTQKTPWILACICQKTTGYEKWTLRKPSAKLLEQSESTNYISRLVTVLFIQRSHLPMTLRRQTSQHPSGWFVYSAVTTPPSYHDHTDLPNLFNPSHSTPSMLVYTPNSVFLGPPSPNLVNASMFRANPGSSQNFTRCSIYHICSSNWRSTSTSCPSELFP